MPRQVRAAEWERIRDLRLRAIADSPEAFAATLEEARQRSDDEWRDRFAFSEGARYFVEEVSDRGLVGMAFGFYDATTKVACLGGMFVERAHRRAGIGLQLAEAVESWASERGAERIELEANPGIASALRLYESRDFRQPGAAVRCLSPIGDCHRDGESQFLPRR